jgi:hypothetical protein
MCDHIIEELLIKCGDDAIDLAISNVKAGGGSGNVGAGVSPGWFG